ncbi:hypothetical protein CHUAL_009152 [Chamberlinius hualienensis]
MTLNGATLLLLFAFNLFFLKNIDNCDVDNVDDSDGTPVVTLGALFPIHVYSPNHSDCGRIQLEDGIQPLEALLFTLQHINDKGILPGFRLAVKPLLDSCDNVVHALEQSLRFIKGFICDESEENQLNCRNGSSTVKYTSGYNGRIVGVIGGQASQVSIQVANLLRIFHIPQISYLSTSTTLSNKEMFSYFYRTVPSDLNQVEAIVGILDHFNWTYVSLVYSNTEYGNKGLEELERLAPKFNICFASLQRINVDRFKPRDYDEVIQNLKDRRKARVVVIFSDKKVARGLMSAVKRQKAVGEFVWIGSDGWSGRHTVVERHEKEIEGTIAVQPMWGNLTGFDRYFQNLRPSNYHSNCSNPWFNEFWEEFFQCRLAEGPDTPFNTNYEECFGNETIAEDSSYRQQTYLHFVRDSAYAFAHALIDMHNETCGPNNKGLCQEMQEILDGCRLKQYLDKVQFQDVNGKMFQFQPNGDGPPRYTILNYQHTEDGYIWKVIGSYMPTANGNPVLTIDDHLMKFFAGSTKIPTSYCSEPCRPGQAKIQQEGDTCCWVCTNCTAYQILSSAGRCDDCPFGTSPDTSLKKCVAFPVEFVEYSNQWAMAAITVAGMGLIVTAGVGIVFWVYSDTPIVKAAGRELSFILLNGIFMSYGLTFIIVAKPSTFVCGATRFCLGFCYTLCYSAIVTKTNRIARIFNSRHKRPRKTRYISPASQVIITIILTSAEVIINAAWLILHPPNAIYIYPSRDETVLICSGSEDTSYLVGLIYPFVLIGFCTVYAFKTRKCPDGFNEARYIAFANYTTTILWLAFMPLFFTSTSSVKRTITLSFSLSLAATVLLVCLFMPKIYKVLFKPEKNTKEGVMNQHRSCPAPFSPTIQINGSFSESGLSKLSQPAASYTCLSNMASDSSISKQTRSLSADAAVSIPSPHTSKSDSLHQDKPF